MAPLVLSGVCSLLSLSPAMADVEEVSEGLDEVVATPVVAAPAAVNYASKVGLLHLHVPVRPLALFSCTTLCQC